MEQKLRNLQADDLFIVSTLIAKLGFKELGKIINKDTLKALIAGENYAENGMAIAFDVAGLIICNLENCKTEVYQILSNLSGLEVAEIAKLDAVTFIEMIVEVIANPHNRGFLKLASRFRG